MRGARRRSAHCVHKVSAVRAGADGFLFVGAAAVVEARRAARAVHRVLAPRRAAGAAVDVAADSRGYREANKSLASTRAPYYWGMERVDALGVRPAVAAAGAPERASLEQVFGRPDLKVGRQNERKGSQQVARLREWGLLGARWCPPHTMASMTAMLARVEEWSGALPEGSKERKPPREVLMRAASEMEAPTAARSSSNHLWWVREGRRLTAGERLCLMGVCTGPRLFLV